MSTLLFSRLLWAVRLKYVTEKSMTLKACEKAEQELGKVGVLQDNSVLSTRLIM